MVRPRRGELGSARSDADPRRVRRGSTRTVLCAAAALAAIRGAAGQELLRDFVGQPTQTAGNDRFGTSVAIADDIDMDGIADVIVGAPREDRTKSNRPDGCVYVISGSSGVPIRSHVGARSEELGVQVIAGADFDGDGVGDYAASARVDTHRAYVWSGRTGALHLTLTPAAGEEMTGGFWSLPDVDLDGCMEIGLATKTVGAGWTGKCVVLSGKSGAKLGEYLAPASQFTLAACALDDVNADGVEDFAVGYYGRVDLVDGLRLMQLAVMSGDSTGANEAFGSAICRLGDLDRDGVDEFAISDPCYGSNDLGAVHVCSGASQSELFRADNPDPVSGARFGALPERSLGDANGDGTPDLVVGYIGWMIEPPQFQYSMAAVISGRSGRSMFEFRGASHAVFGDEQLGLAVGIADLDGDGLAELVAGAPNNWTPVMSGGVVHVHGGNDLFLQANQSEYGNGDPIEAWVRGGDPLEACLIALVEANGVALFEPLQVTLLDGSGECSLVDVMPPGLAGNRFRVQALATRSGRGGLASSSVVEVVCK